MASQHSEACCTIPPVVTENYEGKGKYITVDGMKTYVTGPDDAKRAILVIYDIFGFFPQTIQGADILATSDKERSYKVFMPDYFEGKPADISWYPPDTKEKGEKLGAFFSGPAAPPKTVPRVPKVVEELKKGEAKGIESWGVVGYCWGGKIINLTIAQSPSTFKAAAACHPAMVDPHDAKSMSIPFLMLPSKDESKDDVAGYEKNLKAPHQIKWYDDQVHGFMAARGDLKDANVKKQYEDGYKTVLEFFHKHM